MKASFPTEFDAVILGKSREAGGFDTPDGRVEYGEAYDLSFDSSEGLVQTCRCSLKHLDEVADFDVLKQPSLTPVRVRGDVNVSDRSTFFRPTEVRLKAPVGKPA